LQIFFQAFINAISLSFIYILFALGLTLLLGIFDVFVFCHGEFVMLAAFITYFIYGVWGLPYILAFLVALPIVSLIGIALEKGIFYPMRTRHHLDPALATFGALGIMQTGAYVLWGGVPKGIPPVMGGLVQMGQLVFPLERLPIIVAGLLMVLLLKLFVQRTKLGLGIRAVQQQPDAATLHGINVSNIRITTWLIATSMAAVAGVLWAPLTFIDPWIGGSLLIKGFCVVILGGLGSIAGTIAGGFALGFIDSFGMTYLGTYSYMFGFIIIILVLLLRPEGLMGRQR
jgi:branched-chain amino acid transport system permease protein